MQARHKAIIGILALLALALSFPTTLANQAAAETRQPSPLLQTSTGPVVSLRAASGETIHFRTQNGQSIDGTAPTAEGIPHLVLHRNSTLTNPEERTLLVEVSNIAVPPAGVAVSLQLETQHGDPNEADGSSGRVTVWDETRRIANSSGITETGVTILFTVEFYTVLGEAELTTTPTDYFRYDIAVSDNSQSAEEPIHASSKEYAFLMENQWVTRLPEVRERSPGAAPDELIVYYCDMFPFKGDHRDPVTWLPRSEIPDFVQTDLVPAMVEGFRVQTDAWGFPWDQAWTSYRPGDGAGRLSVALTDGETWYHGLAPGRGNSGIAINVSRGQDCSTTCSETSTSSMAATGT
jgi:hypothetical protein